MTKPNVSWRGGSRQLLPLLSSLLIACEALADEAVKGRLQPPPSERAQALHALAARLGARGATVDNPCVSPGESGCTRTALEPFFESLDSLSAGTATSPTVIAAFGNSLIAGDRIVDILREELQAAFGNAGRGLLLVDRMAPYGLRSRTSFSAASWTPRTLGELRLAPHAFGIAGVYHLATGPRAFGRFRLEGEPQGTLWWLDVPGGGRLSVTHQGQLLARTEPTGSSLAFSTRFDIPPGASTLEVRAEGRGAVVLGLVLEHSRPGIVLDMLGVPSADATSFLRPREDVFKAQLAERSPRLMLFFLGGNEAKRLEWRRVTLQRVRQDLSALLRRAREGAPASACLVVGPIDAIQDRKNGRIASQRPYLEPVIAAEREVALQEGCAFFNLYAAMGGEGSLVRLHRAGFVHGDLVHPRGKGLDLLGQLVTDALLRAWVETPPPPSGSPVASPTSLPLAPASVLATEGKP